MSLWVDSVSRTIANSLMETKLGGCSIAARPRQTEVEGNRLRSYRSEIRAFSYHNRRQIYN